VPVAVVDVREVRVAVHHGPMPVRVRMRFPAVPLELMVVVVMLVVRVAVGVVQRLVGMRVLVPLAHVQPYA